MTTRNDDLDRATDAPTDRLTGRRWWLASALVLLVALAATIPTTGDFGLTWDEPAYRFSQLRSAQWWERLGQARSGADVSALVEPDALLFYWTYGRHGINFHPPLAGQLNLLTYSTLGRWMRDIPARRLASVLEYALTITLAFGFLARRYGAWVGVVAAGALLTMPRVYGDGHLAATDTPGLLLGAATALAFWKGLNEPNGRGWRVAVGVLIGLAFVEKMAAVLVLGPLLLWLVLARLPGTFRRGGGADWIDGLATSSALLAPLALAFAEVLRLTRVLHRPLYTDLFVDRPASHLSGWVLAVPMAVWIVRRLVARVAPKSPVWGAERPGLEIWTAVLAFAPVVGWLGNPAWWRQTLPRLAHYYMLNTDRRGSLPDIWIFYLGKTYEYRLPWHNGWLLIAVTVPATLLTAALIGLLTTLGNRRSDRLPLYFLLHLVFLPVMRMLPTPAHDGVRLFLPTFFFLAAFAGWGAVSSADFLRRLGRCRRAWVLRAVLAALILGPSTYQLVKVHPFELSYYNEWVGGPRGAWGRGWFELSYWYDAFNPRTLAEINQKLPRGAEVDFLNQQSNPMTFQELQTLGELRPDLEVMGWGDPDHFPYVWLLTQDSKATTFTRLLFAMTPWYASQPPQLDGLRVATVADPTAVSRAYALFLLLHAPDPPPRAVPLAPVWVRRHAPFLAIFWGDGLKTLPRSSLNRAVFDWARQDPDGLLASARLLAARRSPGDDPGARRLFHELSRVESYPFSARELLRARPQALVEAVQILIDRPDALRTVITRFPYTDPAAVGGPLDEKVSGANHSGGR